MQSNVFPNTEDETALTIAMSNPLDNVVVGVVKMKCDKVSDQRMSIPFLSKDPLFGSTEDAHNRPEFLMLITPKVAKHQREAQELSDELRRKIHAFVPSKEKWHLDG